MTPRERLLAAIEFSGPDRCPIHHYVFPGAIWRHGQALIDIGERYPDDFGNAPFRGGIEPPEEGASATDVVEWQDGWGTVWRRFFRPRYARMFEVARDGGAHVWFHTDGWILEIIEDLIEIGVTVLDPQHACMGTKRVGEIAGGRVCIRTDIDRQWAIPLGTPDDIREAVREAIECFGRLDGGVILHGEIGPDVPLENIEALYSAFYEYGQYPL